MSEKPPPEEQVRAMYANMTLEDVSKLFPPLTEEERAAMTPEERRHRAYHHAMALAGKIHLDIDLDELRGRRR